MATVGQPLASPEAGWKAVDVYDTNNWTFSNMDRYGYGTASTYIYGYATGGGYTRINFTGSKFRLIAARSNSAVSSVTVSIDGGAAVNITSNMPVGAGYTLAYNVEGMEDCEHYIQINFTQSTNAWYFLIDRIDLAENRTTKPYRIPSYYEARYTLWKTDVRTVNVGDAIPCDYMASSNAAGVFSNFGTAAKTNIPTASSATPNGTFYWVCVGQDALGRKKFIADRNIQHSISWDVLNSVGLASGRDLAYDMATPIVFYAPLNEPSGNIAYDNTMRFSGTCTGTSSVVDARYGRVRSFNGTSDYIQFSNPVIPIGRKSIRFKVNTTSSDTQLIMGNTSNSTTVWGVNVYVFGNKVVANFARANAAVNATVSSVKDINDGAWHDVLITWDGTTGADAVKLYVDDVVTPEATATAVVAETVASTANLVVGKAPGASTNFFAGKLKDIEIYSDIIDPAVVSQTTNKFRYTIGMPSGGVVALDRNNDWDRYMVDYTLGGRLPAEYQNATNYWWNWYLVYSHTVTTATTVGGTARTVRGYSTPDARSTFNTNQTATTVGFRPMLTVEVVNQSPVINVTADTTSTHNSPITITGNITDAESDDTRYRILINSTVISAWTSFLPVPIEFSSGIGLEHLVIGDNYVIVEAEGLNGKFSSTTLTITRTNQVPGFSLSVSRKAVFKNSITLAGQVTDADNDSVKYRLKINNTVKYDWTQLELAPATVGFTILSSDLTVGSNTLTVESLDEYGGSSSWSDTIIKKDLDITYVTSESPTDNFFDEPVIMLKPGAIVLIKTDPLDVNKGYLQSAALNLAFLGGTGGTVKVAEILNDWDSLNVTNASCPTLYTSKAVEHEITGSPVSLDISNAGMFGVAIYTTEADVTFDYVGNSVNIIYQPTELFQPEQVYSNKVRITWKPIILELPETFIKTTLKRSTDEEFSNGIVVYETDTVDILDYLDTSISTGNFFYLIEVHVTQGESPMTTNSIEIPAPDPGYKNVLVESVYELRLADGIAFDDVSTDYNFYTSPDKIKLRPLDIGQQIGGRQSGIWAVEVINSYDASNFEITLRASKDEVLAEEYSTHGLLNDAQKESDKTKVEMSMYDGANFSPIYPLKFSLDAGQRAVFYVRIKPNLTTMGSVKFQIKLTGRPI